MAELRRRGTAASAAAEGGQVDLAAVLPLVDRSLVLANHATLQELADLSELFVELRLRLPLRDMLPTVSSKLHGGAEALPFVVRIAAACGKGSLYFAELFEFCSERLNSMQASDLATYIYEAGRHGLRCRHFGDPAVGRAVGLLPQMSLHEIMRVWQGFMRLNRDRKDFYVAAEARVRAKIGELTTTQLLLALRAAKDLRHINEFVQLHAACCTELMMRVGSLSLAESASCLTQCTASPRYRAQAQGLVRSIEQKWTGTEDLGPLRVIEVVDALETFASYSMKPLPLTDRLDDILVERRVELQYTGNVSLWIVATQSMARMEHMDAKWPCVALELARDRHFVDKVSFFSQSALASSLGRLRLFDEAVFRNIAELLVSDIRLFKDVQDLAPLLWSYATVGYFHKELFDRAYDLLLEWLEGETLDLSQKTTQTAFIQAAWSFALAGHHTRCESFAAVLDYALFGDLADRRPQQVRRLAQLADAVLLEAPEAARNCQYPDRLEDARSNVRTRSVVSSDPVGEPTVLQEVRTTIQELGWPYHAFAMPDPSSAFYVDISLEPKFGRKVGLLVAGRYELVRVGLPGEALPPREAGIFALARRLLARRGWGTAVVDRERWAALPGPEARRAFLERAAQEALQQQPLAAAS